MKSKIIVALAAIALITAGVGCGSDAKPVGPDVRGMALPEAKATLDKAQITYSVKAEDGLFGVVVEENWQVCSESVVNERMVTLHVKKYGC